MSDGPTLARKKTAPEPTTTTTTASSAPTIDQLFLGLVAAIVVPWMGHTFGIPGLLGSLLGAAAIAVIVFLLASLDDMPTTAGSAVLRQAVFVAFIIDAVWVLAKGPLLDALGLERSPWLTFFWFQGIPLIAAFVFACWLTSILMAHRAPAFLPIVVIAWALIDVVTLVFFPPFPWFFQIVDLVVVGATVAEILRTRAVLLKG